MLTSLDIVKNEDKFIDGDFFESLANENVKYIKIDELENFLKVTDLSQITFKILITHNGDKPITKELVEAVFCPNSKIIHWYGQNINYYHEKLTCIPIGLERKRWFPELKKQEQLKNKILEQIPNFNSCPKLIYANFSVSTNSTPRLECFKAAERLYFTNKISNVVTQQKFEHYTNYLTDIIDHMFVLCPEGNGIDTHRMWETLYLDRFPIVTKNYVTQSFKDLPIVILDKWADLNHGTLLSFIDNFDETKYSLEKLSTEYWKNRIYGTTE